MATKFLFNCEWREILRAYPAEVRLEVYEAAIDYAASGTLPELKPMSTMAFSFIKREIDYYNNSYQEAVQKRVEAGKKGAAVRWNGKNGNAINRIDNDGIDSVAKNSIKENAIDGLYVYKYKNKNKEKENIIEDNVKEKEKEKNTLFTEPTIDILETEVRKIAPKERRFVKPTIAEIAAYCRERNNGVEATAFYDFYESKGWKIGNQPMKNWQAAVRTWERQDGRRSTSKPQSTRVELPTDYSKLIPGNHV